MSTALLPPPPKVTVPAKPLVPHRWTLAEYRALDKTGLFHDLKTMLLHGEVYVLPMPSPQHDTASAKMDNYLRGIFQNDPHVRVGSALDIGAQNDPGPDLAVIPGTIDDYEAKHPTTANLIVEVAVSSLPTDLNLKPELYATAKVPEYWVLDVEGRELHVFRDPVARPEGLGSNAYRSHQTFVANDAVSPLAAPAASVKIEDLLPKITTP